MYSLVYLKKGHCSSEFYARLCHYIIKHKLLYN